MSNLISVEKAIRTYVDVFACSDGGVALVKLRAYLETLARALDGDLVDEKDIENSKKILDMFIMGSRVVDVVSK